jgi:hypothetical protein
VALYAVVDDKGREVGYEVIKIRVAPACELHGVQLPDREVYPSNETFGTDGFYYSSEIAARRRFQHLTEAPRYVTKISVNPELAAVEGISDTLKRAMSVAELPIPIRPDDMTEEQFYHSEKWTEFVVMSRARRREYDWLYMQNCNQRLADTNLAAWELYRELFAQGLVREAAVEAILSVKQLIEEG